MNENGFRQFLQSEGRTENGIAYRLSKARKAENLLRQDLDSVVSDDQKMINALYDLKKADASHSPLQNALRAYYRFINGKAFPKLADAMPGMRQNSAKTVPNTIAVNVPACIPGWMEAHNHIIVYDPSVPNNQKIPGLTGFLLGEYDHIVSSKGRYILDDNLSLFENEGIFPMIPVVLSDKLPSKTYQESDEEIAGRIVRSDCSYDEVLKILKIRTWDDRILGEYKHSGCPTGLFTDVDLFHFEDGSVPYIIIYYRNTDCPISEEYMMKISNCLAHEYFHFLHDVYAQKEFADKSAKRNAVTEALADFYAACYTMNRYANSSTYAIAAWKVTEDRFRAWVDKFGTAWPYSNAYYFYLTGHRKLDFSMYLYDYRSFGSFDKFNEVFSASRNNMSLAYDILRTL